MRLIDKFPSYGQLNVQTAKRIQTKSTRSRLEYKMTLAIAAYAKERATSKSSSSRKYVRYGLVDCTNNRDTAIVNFGIVF